MNLDPFRGEAINPRRVTGNLRVYLSKSWLQGTSKSRFLLSGKSFSYRIRPTIMIQLPKVGISFSTRSHVSLRTAAFPTPMLDPYCDARHNIVPSTVNNGCYYVTGEHLDGWKYVHFGHIRLPASEQSQSSHARRASPDLSRFQSVGTENVHSASSAPHVHSSLSSCQPIMPISVQ